MIFSDLVALAKAGYRPADVKEILAMKGTDTTEPEKPAEIPAKESGQPDQEKEVTEVKATESTDKNEQEDLAAQIAALKKQLEETQADLAKAQQANTRKDISDSKTAAPDKLVEDLVRSYM